MQPASKWLRRRRKVREKRATRWGKNTWKWKKNTKQTKKKRQYKIRREHRFEIRMQRLQEGKKRRTVYPTRENDEIKNNNQAEQTVKIQAKWYTNFRAKYFELVQWAYRNPQKQSHWAMVIEMSTNIRLYQDSLIWSRKLGGAESPSCSFVWCIWHCGEFQDDGHTHTHFEIQTARKIYDLAIR